MEYKAEKTIREDRDYYGFKFRTRKKYYDDKIIRQVLGSEGNIYRIPGNPKITIDVGANVGAVSLLCASRGSTVYAFEPEIFNYEMLLHNVEINGLQDKIHCIKKGVGIPGRTKLYIHDENSGTTSSYLTQKGLKNDRYQMVDFISINNVFDDYDINYCDFLKLDCEGSEKDIIEDLNDYLIERIGQISIEFHDRSLIKKLISKLKKWYNPEMIRAREWVFFKK